MELIYLSSVGSTNTWLKEHLAECPEECLVYAGEQTAGRGQRGNSWEAEAGQNLTASLLLRPSGIEPSAQFIISEAVALGVADLLGSLGIEAMVKWPNDIYVGDRKICGILIEHSIMGRSIMNTIAGVGINLNQTVFRSDAPNPVSVRQITGRTTDVAVAASLLAVAVKRRLDDATGNASDLHREFMARLWRGDGNFYPFLDRHSSEAFPAQILDVRQDGTLVLTDSTGHTREYAFKEVEFLLTYPKQ